MHIIKVRNVNEAISPATHLLLEHGRVIAPRAGQATIELDEPLVTTYTRPQERVLLLKERDANPFFHLMESLWIIAGRFDVAFLTRFNKRMAEFSDNGDTFHAAYGYRLRYHFTTDQIKEALDLLQQEPNTRRCVLQIWDCDHDLNYESRDIPCNDLIFVKIRDQKLHFTVCCRSNDMIWGAYGANVVQFSMLQEYMAGMLEVEVGMYNQISDSFHIYLDNPQWLAIKELPYGDYDPYKYDVTPLPIMNTPNKWDEDLKQFLTYVDEWKLESLSLEYKNNWFNNVAEPMYLTWRWHKENKTGYKYYTEIHASDWRTAAYNWLSTREEI